MDITVVRFASSAEATLSAVVLNGAPQCHGLEDEPRAEKIAGETRIPAGTYRVGVRTVGGFHNRYAAKFPDFHKGMLQVMDVPGFDYILIHIGNTDKDTAGCLLVGQAPALPVKKLRVNSSVATYKMLYPKLIEAALAGVLTITYVDSDL